MIGSVQSSEQFFRISIERDAKARSRQREYDIFSHNKFLYLTSLICDSMMTTNITSKHIHLLDLTKL